MVVSNDSTDTEMR